jgi:ribosome maturation protein SDO1
MTRKHDYVIARIDIKGQHFEILVKPDPAFRFKEGEKVDIDEVLWSDTIYKDVRKGLRASPEALKKAFGTEDIRKIAERILKEGELQLTEEQRKRLLEAKRRQIISYIARNAIDPKTKKPIPEQRIEAAMEQLRIGIDLFKDAEAQAVEIVKKLARIMPIRLAKALLEVTIPPQYSGRIYRELQRLGEIKKSEWKNDGSLVAEIEIPAGAQIDVVSKIQKLTRGTAAINVKKVA